jgi:preprotein translocase subunit SecA
MPDRSWERGIHQFIELKEGCEVTRQHESLARITYQRFFRRYRHLCGMTGTAWEIQLGALDGLRPARGEDSDQSAAHSHSVCLAAF